MLVRQLKPYKYLLTLLVLVFSHSAMAQMNALQDTIVLKKKKYKVKVLLEEVLPSQGYHVAYLDNIIPLDKVVEFGQLNSTTLDYVLSRICDNEDLSYGYTGDQLLIRYYDRPKHEYRNTIYGLVQDKGSGEVLIGATVYVREIQAGVATNGYGFYSVTIPQSSYRIYISFVGYETIEYELDLTKDVQFNYKLSKISTQLEEVLVEEREQFDIKEQNILSSTNKLDMEMASNIPYLGEIDVVQSALLLPGISNVGEGVSGVNVRGGAADQNLILLDEATVYNPSHFFGLVSIFNPDAVKDVEILKGDFPAKYGGRNSAVIHVRQKEGDENKTNFSGGLGLIASRLMVDGPTLKGKASYLFSVRSTFWNYLLKNSRNPIIGNTHVSFQDLNAKFKVNINTNNRLYFSSYLGSDTNKFGVDALKKWGNRVASLRWNRVIKTKHFMNFTGYYSQYVYKVEDESETADFVGTSSISDFGLKADFTSFLRPTSLLQYGGDVVLHYMRPGERIPGLGSSENEVVLADEYGIEPSLYFSHERQIGDLTVSLGGRYSAFINMGQKEAYVYQDGVVKSRASIVDTLIANTPEARQVFYNFLPRLSAKYQLNNITSIKIGHYWSVQYMHLLSNTLSPASSDYWQISGKNLLPTTMQQTTLGVYKYVKRFDMNMSVEVFYRKFDNIVDYKDGADLLFNESIETELLFGNERAYGLEIFMKKKFGNLTGWVGYTLSKSERQVNGELEEEKINNGQYFPTNYDRTHDIALTGIYQITKYLSVSSNFVFYTGRPYSFPDSKYEVDGMLVPHFPNRNLDRLSNYHRLDLAATWNLKPYRRRNGKKRKVKESWVFSIYNVYGRRNAQAYFFKENELGQPVVEKLSVLGSMIPSVTYNFKF